MQDLYKQAIADAKALRASAIANAKASLQETFAPQVEALVKQSLREEAEDEAEEKQVKKESKNGAYTKNVKVKAPMKEDLEEDLEEGLEEELEEDLEESTLEEILGELEELELEEDQEPVDDDEYQDPMEENEDGEEEDHEEPDEDNMGGPSDHDADNAEEGEDDEEIVLTFGQLKQALAPFIGGEEGMEPGTDDSDAEEADIDLDEILGEDGLEEELEEDLEEADHYKMEARKHQMKEKKHVKEMADAKEAIEEMRHSLQEVNLLNAKLLYMNKIFKAKSLNEAQKKRVVGAFDRASNVKEVKNIFATLNESITAPKKQLSESFSYASKPMGYAPKQNITEADPFISRMQKLAGIIK
jgi:hypothetical protein